MRAGLGLYGPLESKTPATMRPKIEDRAAAAPLLRTAVRPCPRTLARGLTAATATPSRRAGPRHWRNLRLRRTVVVGRGAPARRAYRCENWWHGCPLRRLTQTSGSPTPDRHGVIGEMANRSATEVPAIETSPAASAGFPQNQRSGRRAVEIALERAGDEGHDRVRWRARKWLEGQEVARGGRGRDLRGDGGGSQFLVGRSIAR